jgi:hypothetical protein
VLSLLDPEQLQVVEVTIEGASRRVNRGLRRFARRAQPELAYGDEPL